MILVIGDLYLVIFKLLSSGKKVKALLNTPNERLERLKRKGLEVVISNELDESILQGVDVIISNKDVEFNKLKLVITEDVNTVNMTNNTVIIKPAFILENILISSTYFKNRKQGILDIGINPDQKICMTSIIDISNKLLEVLDNNLKGVIEVKNYYLSFNELSKMIYDYLQIKLNINYSHGELNNYDITPCENNDLSNFLDNYTQEL